MATNLLPRIRSNTWSQELDRRARTYMFGHAVMSRSELIAAKKAAMDDKELKGQLRALVISRFDEAISNPKRKHA